MCALCAWSLPITWRRWRSHHSICHNRKPHAACKLHVLQKRSYGRSKLYIAGIRIFDPFCSCDLDLDLLTFIYELTLFPGDTWDVQIWTSYVKAFDSYRLTHIHTYRQTDRRYRNYIPYVASRVINKGAYRNLEFTWNWEHRNVM